MAVFSVNQNRHLYISTGLGSTSSHVTTLANPGEIAVGSIGEGTDKKVFFQYVNPKGEIIKSDYIPVKNIDYVKPVKASAMAEPLKKVEVTLRNTVNSGAPIAGQDYLIRIVFRQFYGMSDQDQYIKDVAVHASTATSTAKDLFDAFVVALNKAFSREVGATASGNPYLSFAASGSGSSGKLVITEVEQPWVRGVGSAERVYFDVFATTVYKDGDDLEWATITDATPAKSAAVTSGSSKNAIGNGKKIADLEWFCMGERGDQYRMMGYPNYIPTEYVANPANEYNLLEIHFAFTDTGVNSYRSEKDITIAMPLSDDTADNATIYDNINALIDEFEYHTGLTIAGLADS